MEQEKPKFKSISRRKAVLRTRIKTESSSESEEEKIAYVSNLNSVRFSSFIKQTALKNNLFVSSVKKSKKLKK